MKMSIEIINDFFSSTHQFFDKYRTTIFIASATVIVAHLFNRFRINRQVYLNKQSLKGKTVLITGGNTGIGYETAKDLLRREARVVLVCRNVMKGTQAMATLLKETGSSETNLRLMQCDLCSLNSVRAFAKMYNEHEERLDVLICNAGLGWSPSGLTQDGFNPVIEANYLGHFLLTHLLLDKLKASHPSRIINVSSKLHQNVSSIDWSDAFTQSRASGWLGAYPSSKLYQILSTMKFKQTLLAEGVNAFALTPGWVSTPLSDPPREAAGWFGYIITFLFVRCLKCIFAKTPKTGAQTVIYCAVESTLEHSHDLYFQDCTVAQPSTLAVDQLTADRLWQMSVEAVGLSR